MSESIKLGFLLVVMGFCFFGFFLRHQFEIVQEFDLLLLSFQWVLIICLFIWWGAFFLQTFSGRDLCMIGLLFIAIAKYFIAARPGADAAIFLTGITVGRGVRTFLEAETRKLKISCFIFGLIMLLTFSSWWHLDMIDNFYHGPRWMGLLNNPNDYGMLMGVGELLAIGLLAVSSKFKTQIFFCLLAKIAVFMLAVGLMMSYSRGAWLASGSGVLYLAWCYGKLKWRYVAVGMGVAILCVLFFWGRTADSASWYVKRADLGRPSAQHRASAWRAGLQIMRDHPLGVGWNNAVGVYAENYSPPEGGAPALTTNDYMMIGSELGIPALLCLVGYAALCLWGKPKIEEEEGRILAACRAGAIVLLVAFWFDGGLFKLPTAALFWVLLELGSRARQKTSLRPTAGSVLINAKSCCADDRQQAVNSKIKWPLSWKSNQVSKNLILS